MYGRGTKTQRVTQRVISIARITTCRGRDGAMRTRLIDFEIFSSYYCLNGWQHGLRVHASKGLLLQQSSIAHTATRASLIDEISNTTRSTLFTWIPRGSDREIILSKPLFRLLASETCCLIYRAPIPNLVLTTVSPRITDCLLGILLLTS